MQTNTTVVLDLANLPPNATSDLYGPVNLGNSIKCAITGEAFFNQSAVDNVRTMILSSWDDSSYDTEPYAQFDIPCNPNQTVRTTYAVLPDPKYIKAQVVNLDSNYTAESVRVIVTYTEP